MLFVVKFKITKIMKIDEIVIVALARESPAFVFTKLTNTNLKNQVFISG